MKGGGVIFYLKKYYQWVEFKYILEIDGVSIPTLFQKFLKL